MLFLLIISILLFIFPHLLSHNVYIVRQILSELSDNGSPEKCSNYHFVHETIFTFFLVVLYLSLLFVPLSSVECQDGTESLVNTVGVEVVSGGGKDAGRLGVLEDLLCHENIPLFSNVMNRKIMQ